MSKIILKLNDNMHLAFEGQFYLSITLFYISMYFHRHGGLPEFRMVDTLTKYSLSTGHPPSELQWTMLTMNVLVCFFVCLVVR